MEIKGSFEGDDPTQSLDVFRGNLTILNENYILTDNKQFLFRGSKLKNTQKIWGLVTFTGHCSKVMLNSQSYNSKISALEKKMNMMLIIMFIIQIAICFTMAALALQKDKQLQRMSSYLSWNDWSGGASQYVLYVMMFFIDYSSMIPVSLMVSIELVKLAQSYFIDFDKLMYCGERKKGVTAKNTALN